jgi:ABC-type polysaccharide/polyol phosphate transport system ATPase subunit
MSENAIIFEHVTKNFKRRRGFFRHDLFCALKNVSFEVKKGEAVGIVGPNGAGKTTVLRLLAGVTAPSDGAIDCTGRLVPLIELNAGFHSELTGRENIYLNGSILGIPKRIIDLNLGEMISFAGLEQFIDQPVKNYSFGMFMRLGFSVAVHSEPDILLIDEVLAVGDQAFREKCLERMREFKRNGVTIVLVSHELEFIRGLCSRVIYLDSGQLVATGEPEQVISKYLSHVNK